MGFKERPFSDNHMLKIEMTKKYPLHAEQEDRQDLLQIIRFNSFCQMIKKPDLIYFFLVKFVLLRQAP